MLTILNIVSQRADFVNILFGDLRNFEIITKKDLLRSGILCNKITLLLLSGKNVKIIM